MKILKFLLYAVLGLVALVCLLGFFAKKTYHIERSIEIDAPDSVVISQVRLTKNFNKWQPWNDLDPKMTLTYFGTDGEVGSGYAWKGNEDVGEGKQTLTAATPTRLDYQLELTEPFKATPKSFFVFEPKGEKTKVSWGFDPVLPFPVNVWAMFTDVDKAFGADYERGLGNLKKVCEAITHPKYGGYEVLAMDIPLKNYVGLRRVVPFEEIMKSFETGFDSIGATILEQKLTTNGPRAGIFWNYDLEKGTSDMAPAIPVNEQKKLGNGFGVFSLGGQKGYVIDYFGVYDSTGKAHDAMALFLKAKGLVEVPPAIEEYVTDVTKEPDTSKWLTRVIYFATPKADSTAKQ
jgi:hypothetical protein